MADFSQAIDRLFGRLIATYGAQFMRPYDGVEPAAVKAIWVKELQGRPLESIAWALDNLPPRPPNVIEFKLLTKQWVKPEEPLRLTDRSHVKPDPARLKQALQKLATTRREVSQPKDWAKRVIEQHEAGERVPSYTLELAKQAVRRHDA